MTMLNYLTVTEVATWD